MKIVLFVMLALFSSLAQAQTYCFPKDSAVKEELQGGVLMEGRDETLKGDWSAIWCPTNAARTQWELRTHAVLDTYKTMNAVLILQIARGIIESSDPIASLTSSIKAAEVIPPEGTADRFALDSLRYTACKQGVALPPATGMPVTDNCKAPTPLPVPTTRYVVSGSQAFPLTANGTRAVTAWPTAPKKGEPCDCTVQLLTVTGARYCKVPSLSTAAQTVVAGCSVQK